MAEKYVLVCDYDLKRAEEVVGMMKGGFPV